MSTYDSTRVSRKHRAGPLLWSRPDPEPRGIGAARDGWAGRFRQNAESDARDWQHEWAP